MPLAALHLLTLGVFGMAALGAGSQLMPVATRQSPVGARWLTAIWWAYTPGVGVLAWGMATGSPLALLAGGVAVVAGLAAWGGLMARHLAGARGMPGVRWHAWASLACLSGVLATGIALVAWWTGRTSLARDALVAIHFLLAPFGFMGLLSVGLSYILVPMFALAPAPGERAQLGSLCLLAAALALGCMAQLSPFMAASAWVFAASGVAWHLALMAQAQAGGMRHDLGLSFTMVRFGWCALAVALAGIAAQGFGWSAAPRWIAAATLCWLASVLFGFLQRILPFLASLHAGAGRRRGPTATSLSNAGLLRAFAAAHFTAWCAVALALATGSRWVAAGAALAGLAGSVAFAAFYAQLVRRLRASRA